MEKTSTTLIAFPNIKVDESDARKLRANISDIFKERNPLLHGHFDETAPGHRYPLVQYKVLNGKPHLLALAESAPELQNVFLDTDRLKIGQNLYPAAEKTMHCYEAEIGMGEQSRRYNFQSLWMAMKPEKLKEYNKHKGNPLFQTAFLEKLLVSNIIAFNKGVGYREKERISLSVQELKIAPTQFKNSKIVAFTGEFTTNYALPQYVGLGKAVEQGFGAVRRIG